MDYLTYTLRQLCQRTPDQRALDTEARTLISQELGHNHMQITSIYCGR
jgi:hypothetical protein